MSWNVTASTSALHCMLAGTCLMRTLKLFLQTLKRQLRPHAYTIGSQAPTPAQPQPWHQEPLHARQPYPTFSTMTPHFALLAVRLAPRFDLPLVRARRGAGHASHVPGALYARRASSHSIPTQICKRYVLRYPFFHFLQPNTSTAYNFCASPTAPLWLLYV